MRMLEEDVPVTRMEEVELVPAPQRKKTGMILLAGGVLGVVSVGFVLAAPEIGLASAVAGTLAGIGSAGVTLLARK